MIPIWEWAKYHFDTKWNNLSLSADRNDFSLEVAIGCTVNCRAKAIIYWEYSNLWRLFCYNWAVHCRHKHNLMKQLQLFKVDIYSQIQLYHQRIRARCCPWGKAAWTCSLLKGKPSFVEQEAHSTDKPLRLSAGGWNTDEKYWKLWPSSPPTILGILRPHPKLVLSCTCKQNTDFVN